jgi:hypothetical protein
MLEIFKFKFFLLANQILQNFLSVENFPEWKRAFRLSMKYGSRDQRRPRSFLQKKEEPGNEVGIYFGNYSLELHDVYVE